ncbi:MAG: alpha-amylase family glycosyl hydrolase [Cyanophyceae cyanobacterium]
MAWYKDAVFYEVYLPSFQDSNGDGIGDLGGVRQRLNYFQELGIDALWITPFYESPGIDNGYDISNHTAIDSKYGTMADFEALVEEASQRNIKIVVDIILNHTSDEHPFFMESRQSKDSPKRDWYIWKDAKADGSPPNNWEGFEKSSWTWDEKTQQYYYHFHYPQQPDLNWRNPDVVKAMFDICTFWVNKGVAGLRLDAINFLLENETFEDNPEVDELPEYIQNIYQFKQLPINNIDHPGNHGLLQQLRTEVSRNQPVDPLLIGEVWVKDADALSKFYGDDDNELQLPFNFLLSSIQKFEAGRFYDCLHNSYQALGDRPTTVVLSNHDFPRSTTRYIPEAYNLAGAKLLATLLLTAYGAPFLYYGEELGLQDMPPETLEEVRDPRGRLRWPHYKGRDGCRRPMPWDSSPTGGFSHGTPWLGTASGYASLAIEAQRQDSNSVWNFYKSLIAYRKASPALTHGTCKFAPRSPKVLAYERQAEGDRRWVVLNFTEETVNYDLNQLAVLSSENVSKQPIIEISNLGDRRQEQYQINKNKPTLLVLNPFESIVMNVR